MWKKIGWVLAVATFPAALGYWGCTTSDPEQPNLAGPSVLAIGLQMSANPDQLTADGWSSSVIEVVWRDENGQRTSGGRIDFDLQTRGTVDFQDIGNLAPLDAPRPAGGGNESTAVSAVTDSNGVAQVRYWAPFRTDQANDLVVTITSRPSGSDFRGVTFRQVDIFLRAADRPLFPGTAACGISVEPMKATYDVGEPIFFTAIQSMGPSELPIARYEWQFGDAKGTTAVGRSVSHAYALGNDYTVTLVTTESVTGLVSTCETDPPIKVR
jgi:hypothetical protein